ncbi:hypothetical protein BJV82DRAFT_617342 [Fennellomyces sp. T-0311]|nr:hypothetical protein BJV82DRAFT_617342 [Fennellomyces sp. T-0311]
MTFEHLPFDYNKYCSFINLFEQQAVRYGDRILTRYQLPNQRGFKTMTYAQADRIASNLAYQWAPCLENIDSVGFIADHSIHYFIAMLAIFKLQPVLLALSPRNPVAANVNLLTKTASRFLIVSEKYSHMAKECAEQVPGGCGIKVLQPFDLELLDTPTKYTRRVAIPEDIEKIAMIIHSSGTTSFPKPIHLSNRYMFWLIQIITVDISKEVSLNSSDVILSSLPLFHVFGVFSMFTPVTFGASSLIFGRLPPAPRDIVSAIESFGVTMMTAPPIVLESIAQYIEDTDCDTFSSLKFCLYGGAPLRKAVGDFFHSRNVNVHSAYGTTELCAMAISSMRRDHKKWYAVKPASSVESYCYWEPFDEAMGIYQLVIKANYPAMATGVGNRPNGDYATSDLFMQDPPNSGYWRHLGRNDDTLVMENGEKVNPTPMEHAINSAKVVKCSTVIGEGRQCTAALVELELEQAVKYSPQEMIDQVHKAVEQANKNAPSYSTILPQMVYVLPLNQQLPTADKGNVIRKRAIKEYQEQIDKMYDDFLQGPTTTTNDDSDLSLDEFLAQAASQVLHQTKIDPSTSLFDYGLNSLLAIQLRNLIAARFENVPSNFLFEHPTLVSMIQGLTSQLPDEHEQRERRYKDTQDILNSYIERADVDFPVATNTEIKHDQHTVLLTGATGSLGAFMLRDMILSPRVKKIYCLVRGNNLMQRVEKSFQDRLLDVSLLESKVEVLPMKLDAPYLGWDEATYAKLKHEITIVQHCAWLLDFNQPVQHFDRECIRGMYNLLKFAYRETDPMHVHVVSSISATAAFKEPLVPEDVSPQDPHVAMPMGYAQSKYIVEHLFHYLTQQKNFPCTVERMGQVCGDTEHGVWNTSEQYPLLMIGGTQLGLMPDLQSVTIDWLPVNIAATSIVDIMLGEKMNQGFFHIVNPQRVTWSDVLKAMQSCNMNFQVVKPEEWVQALRKHQDNPAYRLMSFFEANFKSSGDAKMPVWQTDRAIEAAPCLGEAPPFDTALLQKHLAFWRNVGFYTPL